MTLELWVWWTPAAPVVSLWGPDRSVSAARVVPCGVPEWFSAEPHENTSTKRERVHLHASIPTRRSQDNGPANRRQGQASGRNDSHGVGLMLGLRATGALMSSLALSLFVHRMRDTRRTMHSLALRACIPAETRLWTCYPLASRRSPGRGDGGAALTSVTDFHPMRVDGNNVP